MYTFSYHYETQEPTIVRRPWWQFWGRDRIGTTTTIKRRTLSSLSAHQGQWLVKAINDDKEMAELLVQLSIRPGERVMPGTVVLEQGYPATPYIETRAEAPVTVTLEDRKGCGANVGTADFPLRCGDTLQGMEGHVYLCTQCGGHLERTA